MLPYIFLRSYLFKRVSQDYFPLICPVAMKLSGGVWEIMKPIVTLTLNPSIDAASKTETVRPTRKVRTFDERYDPGGGGINVARVINELGGRSLNVIKLEGIKVFIERHRKMSKVILSGPKL